MWAKVSPTLYVDMAPLRHSHGLQSAPKASRCSTCSRCSSAIQAFATLMYFCSNIECRSGSNLRPFCLLKDRSPWCKLAQIGFSSWRSSLTLAVYSQGSIGRVDHHWYFSAIPVGRWLGPWLVGPGAVPPLNCADCDWHIGRVDRHQFFYWLSRSSSFFLPSGRRHKMQLFFVYKHLFISNVVAQ